MNEFEQEDNEVSSLLRDRFWSKIRSELYKKICKGEGGGNQWLFIVGKKSECYGKKIRLTDKSIHVLEKTVSHLNTSDAKDELISIGVIDVPESVDDLVDILQNSKTSSEVRHIEFKVFLKNRDRLLRSISNY